MVSSCLNFSRFINCPPHTLERFCLQAQSSKLLKDVDFKDVFDLKTTQKISLYGENINFLNVTAVHENKNPNSIQTWDLQVGRPKKHPLCHTDRQQIFMV